MKKQLPRKLNSFDSSTRSLTPPGPNSIAEDLQAVNAEIKEVKAALRHGGSFLGMNGTLLQEYFVELTRKDNLLRLALSRAGIPPMQVSAAPSPSGAVLRPLLPRQSPSQDAIRPRILGERMAASPTTRSRLGSCDGAAGVAAVAVAFPTVSRAVAVAADSGHEASASSSMPVDSKPSSSPEDYLKEVDCGNLAAVLKFLEAHVDDLRAQRIGVHAIGRLSRDEGQLRPLCLAAAAAVTQAIASFPSHRGLQRLAVAALGSLAYTPQVATLISQEVLPSIFASMIAQAGDEKLQDLACEALARLAQSDGTPLVVKATVQTMLGHADSQAVEVCCRALRRLRESGICGPNQILEIILPLTESQPSRLVLQQRACCAMQLLVKSGAVDKGVAMHRASPLLSSQWTQILVRFVGADCEEVKNANRFHADVQNMFHEEVVKHFEYEAAERCLHLSHNKEPGMVCLREVLKCLVENLEDYEGRLGARELAWDETQGKLMPLDASLRRRLQTDVLEMMQPGLIAALQAAAASDGCSRGVPGETALARRRSLLRADCASLLDRKTEVTQAHHERAQELRREVMLFEAVEYLELQATAPGRTACATQIRTALFMLDEAESVAPADAIERLRERLDRLSARLLIPPPPG